MKEKPAMMAPASGPTVAAEAARRATFRRHRLAAGFTQEGLALAAGLSRTYVKKLELGRLPHPTSATREALAQVLGLPPGILFEGFSPSSEAEAAAARDAFLAEVKRRRGQGETMPEIAEALGCSTTTVWKSVHELKLPTRMGPPPKYPPPNTERTCAGCGGPVRFRAPYYAARAGGRSAYCSRKCFLAHVKKGESVSCPMCGRERYRPASHARKRCCGYGCHARYRWHVTRAGLRPLIESWKSSKGWTWGGRARQVWLGRIGAREKGGRREGQLSYWNRDAEARLAGARSAFIAEHGRKPSLRELEDRTGIPKSTIARLSH